MDTLLFLLMFAGAWLVLGWYMHNEVRSTPGTAGLLAIRNDARPGTEGAAAYRVRPRRLRGAVSSLPEKDGLARYRQASDASSYRNAERAGYTERGATYREKPRAKDRA